MNRRQQETGPLNHFDIMTNQEVVSTYLDRFCAGDIEGIAPLLAGNLSFVGTFYTYHSRAEYLESLKNDPPQKSGYEILSISENAGEGIVAVFYDYQKPDRTMQIAQLFKIRDQQIHEVLLIFDGRGFD